MRAAPLLACLAALSIASARAAEPAATGAAPPGPPPGFEFETFQLVMLVRAPTWKQLPDAEAQALQAKHIGHLTRMGDEGKAMVCGPFGNQREVSWRGACLYRVATPEEARALAEADPIVQAGQLRVEVVTWAVGKGYMAFPKAPPRAEPAR